MRLFRSTRGRRPLRAGAAILSALLGAEALAQDPPDQPAGAPAPGAEAAPAKKRVSAREKQSRMRELFQIMRIEPQVRTVQDWSLRFYKLEPDRVHALARNARLKGLIPEIEASLDNSLGHQYTNTRDGLYPALPSPPENPNPESLKERISATNDQLTWRVRAAWQLDRLVFNAEALDAKSLTSLQENLTREVTALFYARRRLVVSLILSPPEDEEELIYELMRLEELTATLDAMTGGKFATKAWRWEDPSWAKKTAGKK